MKRIVYIFDNINYKSGAQKAALYQIQRLSEFYDVYVMTLVKPIENIVIPGKLLPTESLWKKAEIYARSFREVLEGKYSIRDKLHRIGFSVALRLGKDDNYLDAHLYEGLQQQLEIFDAVIVVSEASKIRHMVAKLTKPKKIQWIHTDYALWSQYSEWTKSVTKDDGQLYKKFDHVVVLSEKSKQGMEQMLPELRDKFVVIPNMVNVSEILERAAEEPKLKLESNDYKIVTVGRLDKEKNFDRILRICQALKEDRMDYRWYIIGDGSQKEYIKRQISKMNLEKQVVLLGQMNNPYPIMKQCDFFVLLSDYEGTPVTIDEAAVLGIPVIATPVGGIPEQLKCYGVGELVENNKRLYESFKSVLKKQYCCDIEAIQKINSEFLEKIKNIL